MDPSITGHFLRTFSNRKLLLYKEYNYIEVFNGLCSEFKIEPSEVIESIPRTIHNSINIGIIELKEIVILYFLFPHIVYDEKCVSKLCEIHKRICYGTIYEFIDEITTLEDIRSKCEEQFEEITTIHDKTLYKTMSIYDGEIHRRSTAKTGVYDSIYDLIFMSYRHEDMNMVDIIYSHKNEYKYVINAYPALFIGFGLQIKQTRQVPDIPDPARFIPYSEYCEEFPVGNTNRHILDIRV